MSCNLPRKRDKPLRTYGKRSYSAADEGGEPPAKKRSVATDNSVSTSKSSRSTSEEASSRSKPIDVQDEHLNVAQPPSDPDADMPRPSSILSYFKRIAPTKHDAPEDPRQATPEEPSLYHSEDEHPKRCTATARRKPRLLRLRAASSPLSDEPNVERSKSRQHTEQNESCGERRRKEQTNASGKHDSSGHCGEISPISQASECNTMSRQSSETSCRTKTSRRIQTTLNLSTQAAFAECQVCDTVWNPLYPDDVKYHAKRHATVTRAKTKKQDNL
ncbi:hypothetical protein HIM_02221 [Hirsutella minnesotensis 3608]|nr:hypothetical protein HIM_02221 [Hirsutella minnesotensis 3608]